MHGRGRSFTVAVVGAALFETKREKSESKATQPLSSIELDFEPHPINFIAFFLFV